MKKILNNSFFKGSLIMLLGSNIYNLGQFIYHFLAGRFLGKALYGDLASIISLIAYFGIIQLALGLTIVKFIAQQKNKNVLFNFVKWFNLWGLVLAGSLAVIALMLAPFIAGFLNINYKASFYVLPVFIFFFSIIYIHRSILQGLLKFKKLALSYILETVLKIVLTLFFIILGWSVFGAVVALTLTVFIVFLMTRISLASLLRGKKREMPKVLPLVKYSFPVLMQGLALNSMYSTDLILVKHFLSSQEAGIYASLSILGRIVFFGSTPILQVMFPYVAKKFSQGQSVKKIFIFSLLLTASISFCIILAYYFLPQIFINVLYGREYLQGAPILWIFGVSMGLLSLSTLFIQFFLSIEKSKVVFIFVLTAILQAVLILMIHNSILEVLKINILTTALLLGSLCVYFAYVVIRGSSGIQTRKDNQK